MRPSLVPGLKHSLELTVTPELTVPHLSPHLRAFADMPPVFATAMMVGLLESACIESLKGHLDDGEHSVGTHVDVSHIASSPVGMIVRADVELTGASGRMLSFAVKLSDNDGPIGEGTHQRAVIKLNRFMEKLEASQIPLQD